MVLAFIALILGSRDGYGFEMRRKDPGLQYGHMENFDRTKVSIGHVIGISRGPLPIVCHVRVHPIVAKTSFQSEDVEVFLSLMYNQSVCGMLMCGPKAGESILYDSRSIYAVSFTRIPGLVQVPNLQRAHEGD